MINRTHKSESPAATGLNAKIKNTNVYILTERSADRKRPPPSSAITFPVDRYGNSKTHQRFQGIVGGGRRTAATTDAHILEAIVVFGNRAARRHATRDLAKRKVQK